MASLSDDLNEEIERAAERIATSVAKAVAAQVEARLSQALTDRVGRPGPVRPPRSTPGGVTAWVADHKARRVPNFVIEQTGLKTKQAVVAKFGENARFQKGKAPKSK